MEMQFSMGQPLEMRFSMGGSGSATVMPIIELTQEAYDALDPPDANTLYAIPEVE